MSQAEVSSEEEHQSQKSRDSTRRQPAILFSYVSKPGLTSTIPEEFQKFANYQMNKDEDTLILETFE